MQIADLTFFESYYLGLSRNRCLFHYSPWSEPGIIRRSSFLPRAALRRRRRRVAPGERDHLPDAQAKGGAANPEAADAFTASTCCRSPPAFRRTGRCGNVAGTNTRPKFSGRARDQLARRVLPFAPNCRLWPKLVDWHTGFPSFPSPILSDFHTGTPSARRGRIKVGSSA